MRRIFCCWRFTHRARGGESAARLSAGWKKWREPPARNASSSSARENVAARNFYGDHCYHERDIARGMYRGIEDGVRLEKWLR